MDQTSMSSSKANDRQVGGTHYQDAVGQCPHCSGTIQHWDLFAKMPYLVGQVCRYVLRFRGKNGKQDLEKAGHFLKKLMEVYFPESKEPLWRHTLEDREDGLANCTVCYGAEVDLPSDCPGHSIPHSMRALIAENTIDFIDGKWCTPAKKARSPVFELIEADRPD